MKTSSSKRNTGKMKRDYETTIDSLFWHSREFSVFNQENYKKKRNQIAAKNHWVETAAGRY